MMLTYLAPGHHGTGDAVWKWMAEGCHIQVISGPAWVPDSRSWTCRHARTKIDGLKWAAPQEYHGPFISDPNEIVIGILSLAMFGTKKLRSQRLYTVVPRSPMPTKDWFLGISSSTVCAPMLALFRILAAGK